MSRVIRVSDETFSSLQKHGLGFRSDPLGTPGAVVEHLLRIAESSQRHLEALAADIESEWEEQAGRSANPPTEYETGVMAGLTVAHDLATTAVDNARCAVGWSESGGIVYETDKEAR